MRTENPPPVKLADYAPPPFFIDKTELEFRLDPAATRVKSRLAIRRNGDHAQALVLDGGRLETVSIALDGRPLGVGQYAADAEHLTIPTVPDAFVLETEVEIAPEKNTWLSGLYMSAGRFCTQCEAEGFRNITWFADRPDVLSRFTVRIEADCAFPRLLANGNLIEAGEAGEGRHFAVWEDPFPKPSYLFALVAGELDVLEDSFVTMSGRKVDLRIYSDPGMAPRTAYAMDSLKRAMRWDEETFGLEYDLDLFMIVAVRDFNFGAMENKGLNIFNSALLLADPATATDTDFERIEGVVAHEYFHNWTGNRVTCRDWFQLCLKEGLTVFRDQSFSADQRGAAMRRIKDVKALRARQFSEDASPLAHPVRPSSFVKIDNFYTPTIYEKGAEVIRMLRTFIGPADFRRGMDLYFERWDGKATTVEAFIDCFADVSGKDLAPFFAWYEQAGTPRVRLSSHYDPTAGTLDISLSQETAPTPGQPNKRPLPIPVALGLMDEDGRELRPTEVVVLDEAERRIRFEGLDRRPIVSALRGFSAPVVLEADLAAKDRYALLAADPDLFNRWEAGQHLAQTLILEGAAGRPDEVGEERYAEAMGRGLSDQSADPAFKALLLELPDESDLAVVSAPADPSALHEARSHLATRIAVHLGPQLRRLLEGVVSKGEYALDAEAAGRRALRNAALELLAADPHPLNRDLARSHFKSAANMTDAMGGLMALALLGGADFETALEDFHERWRDDPLVIDKWFRIQSLDPSAAALERVRALVAHPQYEPRNPNRVRAVVASFAAHNPASFHDNSGAGYAFLADQVLATDGANPSLAAGLVEPLVAFGRYKPELAALMKAQLERIAAEPKLSKNVRELVEKALA